MMKLKVIGVGGCGCSVVSSISKKDIGDVLFVQVDTEKNLKSRKVLTDALGVERDDSGLKEKIANLLADNSHILIVAGMGGRYSVDVICAFCREHQKAYADDGFVWVFSVMPFDFERRDKRAVDNLARISSLSTKVFTFDNNTLRQYNDKPMNEAFAIVDQKVCEVIGSALCYD